MKKASLKLFRKFKKLDLFSWIMYIVVVAWVFSLICVLGICVLNSFKGDWDIIKYSFFEFSNLFSDDPRLGFHIENYVNIFRPVIKGVTDIETSKYYNYLNVIVGEASNKVYIYELLWNSVFYSTMMTLFLIATQVMVAYAVAKYNFKILNWYYRVAVIVMLIPIVGSLASELRFLKFFSFENNVLGVSIMRCKYPGIYFLVFYAMFKGLSSTYMEAAQLDGAGHYAQAQMEKDERRTCELQKMNLKVMRFTNMDIDRNFAGVCEAIDRMVCKSLPQSAALTAPSSEGAK